MSICGGQESESGDVYPSQELIAAVFMLASLRRRDQRCVRMYAYIKDVQGGLLVTHDMTTDGVPPWLALTYSRLDYTHNSADATEQQCKH